MNMKYCSKHSAQLSSTHNQLSTSISLLPSIYTKVATTSFRHIHGTYSAHFVFVGFYASYPPLILIIYSFAFVCAKYHWLVSTPCSTYLSTFHCTARTQTALCRLLSVVYVMLPSVKSFCFLLPFIAFQHCPLGRLPPLSSSDISPYLSPLAENCFAGFILFASLHLPVCRFHVIPFHFISL